MVARRRGTSPAAELSTAERRKHVRAVDAALAAWEDAWARTCATIDAWLSEKGIKARMAEASRPEAETLAQAVEQLEAVAQPLIQIGLLTAADVRRALPWRLDGDIRIRLNQMMHFLDVQKKGLRERADWWEGALSRWDAVATDVRAEWERLRRSLGFARRPRKRRRKGRPLKGDEKADTKLYQDWLASGLRSHKDFARARGLSWRDVKLTIERVQQRNRRQRPPTN
jgi:hypothetical protein